MRLITALNSRTEKCLQEKTSEIIMSVFKWGETLSRQKLTKFELTKVQRTHWLQMVYSREKHC